MPNAVITGTGFYVPEKVVTNEALKEYYDTSHEWIVERSGIEQRYFASLGVGPSDLALPASQAALNEAGISAQDLDLIIFATLSPECWFPGSGCFLHRLLGLDTTPALDIRMQCSGFIYGLSIAEQYIKTGKYKHILVVGAEVQSTSIDFSNEGRTVGVLFGDGAGAVVVSASEENRGIRSTHLHTQGEHIEKLWVPEPSSRKSPKVSPDLKGLYPIMNGREVFKHAVQRMKEGILEAMQAEGWSPEEVNLFITHQANLRISMAVAEWLEQPIDRFYNNIQRYGNTTAASIPICLAEAWRTEKIKKGDKIILAAFGSGFTWASAALIW
ncbi:MAG: beta-ketoacyl-ACP synthase III [Bacteroidia bacterium]|nr:ketoacyl-ACP synthase III [Bacteroidia bacterium]MDW8158163.1 beta-ketoacyl-ACP synthase III [Bacteroidia bacterium]